MKLVNTSIILVLIRGLNQSTLIKQNKSTNL